MIKLNLSSTPLLDITKRLTYYHSSWKSLIIKFKSVFKILLFTYPVRQATKEFCPKNLQRKKLLKSILLKATLKLFLTDQYCGDLVDFDRMWIRAFRYVERSEVCKAGPSLETWYIKNLEDLLIGISCVSIFGCYMIDWSIFVLHSRGSNGSALILDESSSTA